MQRTPRTQNSDFLAQALPIGTRSLIDEVPRLHPARSSY